MRLAEHHESVQAFGPQRLHPPLGEGVRGRGPRPDPLQLRTYGFRHRAETGDVPGVVIDEQVRARQAPLRACCVTYSAFRLAVTPLTSVRRLSR